MKMTLLSKVNVQSLYSPSVFLISDSYLSFIGGVTKHKLCPSLRLLSAFLELDMEIKITLCA